MKADPTGTPMSSFWSRIWRFGADDSLGDGGLFGEESPGDLADIESADGLECQGRARFRSDCRMAAEEHHRELIIAEG